MQRQKSVDFVCKKCKALVENEVSFYNEKEDENCYLSASKVTGYAADYDPKP